MTKDSLVPDSDLSNQVRTNRRTPETPPTFTDRSDSSRAAFTAVMEVFLEFHDVCMLLTFKLLNSHTCCKLYKLLPCGHMTKTNTLVDVRYRVEQVFRNCPFLKNSKAS